METAEEFVLIENLAEVFRQRPHDYLNARILVSSVPFLPINSESDKLSIWVEDPNGTGMTRPNWLEYIFFIY